MNIKTLLEKYYHVYSPSEEAAENLNPSERSKFNSTEIRNIMMSYFMSSTNVFDNGFSKFVQDLDGKYQDLFVATYEKVLTELKPTSSFDVLDRLSNSGLKYITGRTIREFIDALPDEQIVAFLEKQGDTTIEELKD